jgi:hypothetical protein
MGRDQHGNRAQDQGEAAAAKLAVDHCRQHDQSRAGQRRNQPDAA